MRIEHLDDLPLLARYLDKMNLTELINKHFPDHGLWRGISGGKTSFCWLLYLLSQGDHRLSHVEDWVSERQTLLSVLLDQDMIRKLDLSDDRLGRLLDRFSKDENWKNFESEWSSQLVRIYKPAGVTKSGKSLHTVRGDSFNAPQFRKPTQFFTHGYSKQRRNDQPYCRVMMACVDPEGIPLCVDIVKGAGTDADHYQSVFDRACQVLDTRGILFVGDSQLGSLDNRSHIHGQGNYYLTPLNLKQCKEEQKQAYVSSLPQSVEQLPGLYLDQETSRKAVHFHELSQWIEKDKWLERRILAYSPDYAKGLIKSLDNRIDDAQQAILNLVVSKSGRRNPKTLKDLHVRIANLIAKYKVMDCFTITTQAHHSIRRIRASKGKPAREEQQIKLQLQLQRNQEFIQAKRKSLGWQLYGTNIPCDLMDTSEVVACYRNQYRIEQLFDHLINRDMNLLPLYLNKENRIKGLIRLMTIGMQIAKLVQYELRFKLKQANKSIKGLYPGNKARATDKPTTPMILRAFKGIGVAWMVKVEPQITELKTPAKTILELINQRLVYDQVLEKMIFVLNLRET